MSTKQKKTSAATRERYRGLKKLGVIDGIDAHKKNFTEYEKKKIRKAWKEYSPILLAPKGEFVVKNVSSYDEYDKKILRDTGYMVHKNKAFIPKQGAGSVSLKKLTVRDKNGKIEKQYQVVRISESGRRRLEEIEYVGTPLQKMEWHQRLLHQYRTGKFQEDEFINLKVFDCHAFHRRPVLDINSLFHYVDNEMQFHDDPDTIKNNLHLVKIKVQDIADFDLSIKADLQKSYESDQRKSNRKKYGVKPKKQEQLVGKVKRK